MTSLIALDIETTGLEPGNDAIIEIGALRFNDHRIEGEFDTLIHPGIRIPPFITQLTGITDQMVLNAPPIQGVIQEFEKFLGDSDIVGQNIKFDVAFLNKFGLLKRNHLFDTYELAAVLLPGANRYNLGALTKELNVPYPATHRALDDARATWGVYLRLLEKAGKLPINLLAEIVRLGEKLDWGGYWPFREVLKTRSREIVSTKSIQYSIQAPLFSDKKHKILHTLNPKEEIIPLDVEDTQAMLDIGGIFARQFPTFEHRPQQLEMTKAIAEALSEDRHLLVEAGTGIGKSIAYLLPAALWSSQNDRRIVISTNTINLQDQLINKDIPDLRKILDIDLHATVLKGRSNYLCPRRLEIFRKRGPGSEDELRVLAKILVWLLETETGDRGEINLNGPVEREIWNKMTAEDESCTTENCLRRMGGICPFYRAHQTAINSHLIIVNHALLLADVATGNRVLPEYDYLIIDEAHHLEDATTNALSYRVAQNNILRLTRELGGSGSGILGRLLYTVKEKLSPSDFANFDHLVKKTTDIVFQFENLIKNFFNSIDQFLADERDGRPVGMYPQQYRIIDATRIQPAWSEVEISWEAAQNVLTPLLDITAKLMQGVSELHESLEQDVEEFHSSLSNIYRRLSEFNQQANSMVFEPVQEIVYWVQAQANSKNITLHTAPIHIGSLMERYIWYEKSAVILTSATLTTMEEFDYIRGRLNAEDSYELQLGSPFDYENASLLYLVNDIPEPNDRYKYQKAVEHGLIQLCKATGGRTLVLFTSFDQLRRTSRAISSVLSKMDITVFEQGLGASPHSLLESFRNTDNAVLLGTRSFWEGVDVPGEALSILVIVKLPFDVPSEPIVAARASTFDEPFYEYSLPEAILRFRQGFGRLIRSQSDRGVVVILDRRVLSKKYGHMFIDSLPKCTVHSGPMSDLPTKAARWLNI